MNRIPIILDTDIGSDIDDAVALAYLLRQPRCELVGITTVSGESSKRASLADAVCRAAGHGDIPVHVGVSEPLLISQNQPEAPQYASLSDLWSHREFEPRPTAVDFLRSAIRERPGEITLLAIGPLTNVALLFAMDPEIPRLLRELMVMGGQFFAPPDKSYSEWNIRCDPHAAAMTFAAPVSKITLVGLDVTTRCVMPRDECRQRFLAAGGPLEAVAAMAEVWYRHADTVTFHDPLAAALLFQPELCQTLSGSCQVELQDPASIGQTLWQPQENAPGNAATAVDSKAFFKHYFEIVGEG